MPTNRKRTRRTPVEHATPAWAERLRAGKLPKKDTPEWDNDIGWLYFNDVVPGLPQSNTPEGRAVWVRSRAG